MTSTVILRAFARPPHAHAPSWCFSVKLTAARQPTTTTLHLVWKTVRGTVLVQTELARTCQSGNGSGLLVIFLDPAY